MFSVKCVVVISGLKWHSPISMLPLTVLIPFATTYECETAFYTIHAIKTKFRNRLDVTNDIRVALAKSKPNIEELVGAKQMHPSH